VMVVAFLIHGNGENMYIVSSQIPTDGMLLLLLEDLDGGGTFRADEEGQRSQGGEICIFCGFVSSCLSYRSIYCDTEGLYSTRYKKYLQGSNIRKSFRYPTRPSFRFLLRFTLRCLLALYSGTGCRLSMRILIYSP